MGQSSPDSGNMLRYRQTRALGKNENLGSEYFAADRELGIICRTSGWQIRNDQQILGTGHPVDSDAVFL